MGYQYEAANMNGPGSDSSLGASVLERLRRGQPRKQANCGHMGKLAYILVDKHAMEIQSSEVQW
jgi:hypothetical protein